MNSMVNLHTGCEKSDCTLPLVSVIIACRNEAPFISDCLQSILVSDYQGRIEVLVADGMSTDSTREIVRQYAERYPWIRLVDNPDQITPVAFNIGIRNATGDLIMIMSAHATYAPDAISKCVAYSRQYGADNVGGICVTEPRDQGLVGRAIVLALSHPFGVGGALFRTAKLAKPQWADTAAFGCYRKAVFQKIGLYNEKLVHSQDIELNLRLRHAGGRTLLAPDIVIKYSARSDLHSFWRHNYRNGMWAILPFAYSDVVPVGLRHLIPLAFVSSLLISALISVWSHPFALVLLAILGVYFAATLIASARIAWREKKTIYLFLLPATFALLHIPYGLGSFAGLLKLMSPEHLRNLVAVTRRSARS
jgi:glycosyltransferase involved in cell wall biosynthesis